MRYLLAHITGLRTDVLVGDNLEELLAGIKFVVKEDVQHNGGEPCKCYRLVLDGREDAMTFSSEYTDVELLREARRRILQILKENGWVLYERKL